MKSVGTVFGNTTAMCPSFCSLVGKMDVENQVLTSCYKGKHRVPQEHRAGAQPGLKGQNTLLRGKALYAQTSRVTGAGVTE